jgi:hypothetical protein
MDDKTAYLEKITLKKIRGSKNEFTLTVQIGKEEESVSFYTGEHPYSVIRTFLKLVSDLIGVGTE